MCAEPFKIEHIAVLRINQTNSDFCSKAIIMLPSIDFLLLSENIVSVGYFFIPLNAKAMFFKKLSMHA